MMGVQDRLSLGDELVSFHEKGYYTFQSSFYPVHLHFSFYKSVGEDHEEAGAPFG